MGCARRAGGWGQAVVALASLRVKTRTETGAAWEAAGNTGADWYDNVFLALSGEFDN